MSFPFKGIGFDWAYTLVDLGKEDDRSPLKKVFGYLSSKNRSLPCLLYTSDAADE